MPLTITDDELRAWGMTEREARTELACRLFDLGKLELWPAAQLAGLSRAEFEGELLVRGIPAYRPTLDDLARDMETINFLNRSGR